MKEFTKHKDTPKHVITLSRENRLKPTSCEEIFWNELSGKKLDGIKFRRQFPIGRYIVDFYSHSKKLAIEIDGEIHNEQKVYDKNRDDYIKASGVRVIRFTNKEIENNLISVVETLRKLVNAQ